MTPLKTFTLVALASLATACAMTTPDTNAGAGQDCAQLRARADEIDTARRQAALDRQNAWKLVVPFAVAARAAQASRAIEAADRERAALAAARQRQGCRDET